MISIVKPRPSLHRGIPIDSQRGRWKAVLRRMAREKGKIIIAPGINVWPHELKTAEALAEAGHVVEFVRRREEKRAKSADALIDGVL